MPFFLAEVKLFEFNSVLLSISCKLMFTLMEDMKI